MYFTFLFALLLCLLCCQWFNIYNISSVCVVQYISLYELCYFVSLWFGRVLTRTRCVRVKCATELNVFRFVSELFLAELIIWQNMVWLCKHRLLFDSFLPMFCEWIIIRIISINYKAASWRSRKHVRRSEFKFSRGRFCHLSFRDL